MSTIKTATAPKPRSYRCLKPFAKVYQFKVAIRNTDPLVWRRIQVPGCYSFWDLHCAITDAFGWLDYHLHRFEMPNPKTGEKGEKDVIGIPDEDGDLLGYEVLPGWMRKISRYFTKANPEAEYIYDFGDDWLHSVVLEAILSNDKTDKVTAYPRCIGGEKACPPEDCGGVSGFHRFKKAIAYKNAKDHDELLAWVGGWYDPAWFDPSLIRFEDPDLRWDIAFLDKPVPKSMRQVQYHRMRERQRPA
jgi:hypothetical protein